MSYTPSPQRQLIPSILLCHCLFVDLLLLLQSFVLSESYDSYPPTRFDECSESTSSQVFASRDVFKIIFSYSWLTIRFISPPIGGPVVASPPAASDARFPAELFASDDSLVGLFLDSVSLFMLAWIEFPFLVPTSYLTSSTWFLVRIFEKNLAIRLCSFCRNLIYLIKWFFFQKLNIALHESRQAPKCRPRNFGNTIDAEPIKTLLETETPNNSEYDQTPTSGSTKECTRYTNHTRQPVRCGSFSGFAFTSNPRTLSRKKTNQPEWLPLLVGEKSDKFIELPPIERDTDL